MMDQIEQRVQRYKEEGDEVVAQAIYGALQPYTVQIAYGLLGNKEDADDVSQETWIKVFNHIGKYDPQKSAFKTWVTHIVRNQCIDFLRKKGLRKFVSLDWLLKKRSEPIDQSLSLERHVIKNELWAAIQSLPRKYREVIILRDYFEFKWRDIASILKCGISVVHYRHRRGYEKLRSILGNNYVSDFGEEYD